MKLPIKAALLVVVVAAVLILTSDPAYAVYIPCECKDWWCPIIPLC